MRRHLTSLLAKLTAPTRGSIPTGQANVDHWFIDRWSHYRGSFRIKGWLFKSGTKIKAIELCDKRSLESINAKAVVQLGLTSTDVEACYGVSAVNCRFDIVVDIENAEQALQVALKLHMEDGNTLYIVDPAARIFATDPYHRTRQNFFETVKRQIGSGKVVEIGSRARSGNVIRNLLPPEAEYVGADIVSGPNVDIVCDAHNLSAHFEPNSVDAIFSVSVFEHLLMPWKAVLEMNKILKPGGLVLTMTHQSFPPHDQPWDFWRFTDQAWHGLFNKFTGFEVLETGLGEPLEMVANVLTGVTKGFAEAPGYAGSAAICRKISDTSMTWPANLEEIIRTAYPK